MAARIRATLSLVDTWQTWYRQPVSSTSFRSRSTCFHSLSEQMPGKPWARAQSPSWMQPPRSSSLTSQWATMGLSSRRASAMAARITSSDWTPRPSSEKPATYGAMASRSASSSPRSPRVMAP